MLFGVVSWIVVQSFWNLIVKDFIRASRMPLRFRLVVNTPLLETSPAPVFPETNAPVKRENRRLMRGRCQPRRILEVAGLFFNPFFWDNSSIPRFLVTFIRPGNSAIRPPRSPSSSFSTAIR